MKKQQFHYIKILKEYDLKKSRFTKILQVFFH